MFRINAMRNFKELGRARNKVRCLLPSDKTGTQFPNKAPGANVAEATTPELLAL